MSDGVIMLGLFGIWGFGVATGACVRGYIADKEHDYRWWNEGCRHNIKEKWRG